MKALKLAASFSLVLFIILNSCRKTDLKQSNQFSDSAEINAFLKLPDNADPILVRVTGELRKKEALHPFIKIML